MRLLDDLLSSLRTCFETFPDGRRGANGQYGMADFGMSAFSVFFMQSPSFLAHQRRLEEGHGRSNCQSLFGMSKIPSDNRIRDMLDPASPGLLNPLFFEIMSRLQREQGGLDVFRRLEGHVLIALDGTEYFCSKEIDCPNCLTRRRGTSGTEYYHAMLGATLVAPGHDKVIPLPPEFIVPQDGAEKQDCENAAAKRWLAAHGSRYAALKPIYLGDDLFSRQPLCEAVTAAGGDFIFICKPSSHPLIQEYVAGAELSTCEKDRQKGQKAFRSPLSLALRHSSARWQGCSCCQLVRNRDYRCHGQGHLPQQLRHKPRCSTPQMSRNLPIAAVPGGKSKTKPSTCSKQKDITLSTISVTARKISPPFSCR